MRPDPLCVGCHLSLDQRLRRRLLGAQFQSKPGRRPLGWRICDRPGANGGNRTDAHPKYGEHAPCSPAKRGELLGEKWDRLPAHTETLDVLDDGAACGRIAARVGHWSKALPERAAK